MTAEPDGLLDAFWRYERALMADDLAALDELFAPGPQTLRGDAAGIVVGHDAISAFRRGRGGAPARTIAHVTVEPIDADAALVVAVTEPATGGRGQQTQLWRRVEGRWVVAVAHVSAPPPAIASTIWRTVGTPLVAGGPAGPLAGESVAVKDLFAVAGHPVGAGVPAYLAEASVEPRHAAAVSSLLDAGAHVTGIARTDEFAYSIAGRNAHYGTPPNPAVVGATPGGSTSGPAAAVVSGQVTIGLGTDTGGSLRVPASYTGLWGLRTTHGSVDRAGLLPLAPSFDTVGWLTRDPDTLLRVAATALPDSGDVGTRVIVAPAFSAVIEPEVREAFHAVLTATGLAERVEIIDIGDLDELVEIFRTVQAAEAWAEHGAWIDAHPGALGDDIAARFAWAAGVDSRTEAEARVALTGARRRLDELLGDAVLVLPAASSTAPSATADAATIERTRAGTLRLTCIAGLTGRPSLSAPVLNVPLAGQLTPAPVGLALVGPRGSDLGLVRFAADLAARASAARHTPATRTA